jgi:hypothetical protein
MGPLLRLGHRKWHETKLSGAFNSARPLPPCTQFHLMHDEEVCANHTIKWVWTCEQLDKQCLMCTHHCLTSRLPRIPPEPCGLCGVPDTACLDKGVRACCGWWNGRDMHVKYVPQSHACMHMWQPRQSRKLNPLQSCKLQSRKLQSCKLNLLQSCKLQSRKCNPVSYTF